MKHIIMAQNYKIILNSQLSILNYFVPLQQILRK